MRRVCIAILGLLAGAVLVWLIAGRGGPAADGKSITYWLKELNADEEGDSRRRAATAAIRKIGTNAIPWLLAELQRTDSPFKRDVLVLVGRYEPFDKWLVSEEAHHRQAIHGFEILGHTAQPAIADLIGLLSNTNCAAEASSALVDIGVASLPPLTKSLSHADPVVRCHAARTLGDFGTNAAPAIPALLMGLEDPDPAVRDGCASALGNIGVEAERVVPALIPLLRDPFLAVKCSATLSLSQFGQRAEMAVAPLLAALDDAESDFGGLSALQVIGQHGELVVPALVPRMHTTNAATRIALLACLGSFPGESENIIPILLKAADEPDPQVRRVTIRSLGRLKSKPDVVVPFLIEKLKSPEPAVRAEAADAVGEFGQRAASAIPALTALLEDKAMFGDYIRVEVSLMARRALASIQSVPSPDLP